MTFAIPSQIRRLRGNITVGVVFVSGPGDLAFIDTDATRIYGLIQEGLNWVASNSRSPVNFTFDKKIAPITTPICTAAAGTSAYNASLEENYWRIPAMTALGFSPTTALAYTASLTTNATPPRATDLAFCLFVIKYNARFNGCSFDNGDGLFSYMRYYGQSISEDAAQGQRYLIKNLAAHEASHLFGAADEYSGSNCNAASRFGVLQTMNGNCFSLPGGNQPCVMNANYLNACQYTVWQWGCPSFVTPSGQKGIGGYDLFDDRDLGFAYDYMGTGKLDHLVFYRPGTGAIFIIKNSINDGNGATFTRVHGHGDPAAGIGGWNLWADSDRGFAFDFDSTGSQKFLFFYRARSQMYAILRKRVNPSTNVVSYAPVGRSAAATSMTQFKRTFNGCYSLVHNDIIIPFDYLGSGKQDHLVIYQGGGNSSVCVLGLRDIGTPPGREFVSLYKTNATVKGLGGYDLSSAQDLMTPFDYSGSGKLDHLVLYRPGSGIIWIVKKTAGANTFTAVFQEGTPTIGVTVNGSGIGGYDLMSVYDRCFAFDYNGSGKSDHLMFYRPGSGKVSIVKREGVGFTAVYASTTGGIAGFNFSSLLDKAFAYDYTNMGKRNSLVMYRPTGETATIVPSGPGFKATF